MKVKHVNNCSFDAWYSTYAPVTINSVVLDVPKEFITYLKSDGVVLPSSCEPAEQGDGYDDSDSEAPSFARLDRQITEAIAELGGAVFPKMNWSCPKDAAWISFRNSLKCTCPADVYILLKSSEFVSHDLSDPYQHCEKSPPEDDRIKYKLVLREWREMHPAYEFRCFVKNHQIIGMSQRHPRSHYSFLKSEKDEIMEDVTDFFSKYLQEKFIDPDYVIDVVREKKHSIVLLDINPWGPVTDSLLYSWHELDANPSDDGQEPTFRIVESDKTVSASPYGVYAVPAEVVDFTASADAEALAKFVQLQIQSQNEETDSEEENIT